MALRLDEIAVVVASHQESTFRCVKPPYVEVCVNFHPIRPFGFSHYLTREMSSLEFPDAWSEVAVLLELDLFNSDSKIVGLVHYRRFFGFDQGFTGETSSQQIAAHNGHVESQIQYLLNDDGQIVIPKKWELIENSFNQFVRWHPGLEELMLYALQEFDNLLLPIFGEVSTLALMKETNFLYPFNMFIGSREFYSEWISILRPLISSIETHSVKFEGQLEDRWGGYIAERLFSIYITLCQATNRWSFIEKTVVIFDGRDELTQQRDELTQQRDELTQQRDALLNSTIWKLTKALRVFINIIRR